VAGYYLNDTGYTDVAVLQVRDFEAADEDPLTYSMEFQAVVQKFLNAAVKTGKRKLILDLQGNPGTSPTSIKLLLQQMH
jgi:C-terminal processing protease CtpA/Prc